MSYNFEFIKTIAELVGNASYIECCHCNHEAKACGYNATENGWYINYYCDKCPRKFKFEWVPRPEPDAGEIFRLVDDELEDDDLWEYAFCFDKLRSVILKSENQIETTRILLEYNYINCEMDGYSIEQICEDLKYNRDKEDYILYNLAEEDLFQVDY